MQLWQHPMNLTHLFFFFFRSRAFWLPVNEWAGILASLLSHQFHSAHVIPVLNEKAIENKERKNPFCESFSLSLSLSLCLSLSIYLLCVCVCVCMCVSVCLCLYLCVNRKHFLQSGLKCTILISIISLFSVMRSITNVKQYIHKYKTQADSVVSDTNAFINFLTSDLGDTRRETQFLKVFANQTMLTLLQREAHLVMSKISVCRDPKNPITSFNSQNPTPNSRIPNSRLSGPLSTDSSQKSSGPSLPGLKPFTLQPHFLSGGLL